ncbi:MAG: hypothetical protein ACI9RO_002289, partial [Alteromonas macleodii]
AGQCYAHRILAEFICPCSSHSSSPLLHNMLSKERHQTVTGPFPIPEVKKAPKSTPSDERDTPRYVAKNDNRLVEPLSNLDPEDREEWIAVAHGLKSDGEDNLELFLTWSRGELTGCTPNNYVSDEDVIKTWKSVDPTRTDISALFSRARSKDRISQLAKSEVSDLQSNSHVACAQAKHWVSERHANRHCRPAFLCSPTIRHCQQSICHTLP